AFPYFVSIFFIDSINHVLHMQNFYSKIFIQPYDCSLRLLLTLGCTMLASLPLKDTSIDSRAARDLSCLFKRKIQTTKIPMTMNTATNITVMVVHGSDVLMGSCFSALFFEVGLVEI